MKKPSLALHKLIHSLSKSEKRYFNIFAKRHTIGEKNNYLKIFELIDRQAEYDEEKLKKAISGEPYAGHFAVIKKQLFNLILDSLHSFDIKNNQLEYLKTGIHAAKLLIRKGLYTLAWKEVMKIKKEALQKEYFELALEAIALEKRLLARSYYESSSEKKLEQLYGQEQKIIDQLSNLNAYWRLNSRIAYWHYKKVSMRDPAYQRQLERVAAEDLLQDKALALSFSGLLEFYRTNANLRFFLGKPENAYHFNAALLKELESRPEKLDQYREQYLSQLNNLLIDSLTLNQMTAYEEGIQKLKRLKENPVFQKIKDLETRTFGMLFQLQLNKFIQQQEFMAGKNYLLGQLPEFEAIKARLPRHQQVTFHYLISYIFFTCGDFEKAQEWILPNIQVTREETVEEIYGYSRLLNLLIHYELENIQLVGHLIKSTQHYYKKRFSFIEVEQIIFKYLKRLIGVYSKKEKQQLWQELKAQLLELKQHPEHATAFKYFDFILWVDGKLG